LVLVAVEDRGKHFGPISLSGVADTSATSLIPAVQKSVEKGSLVPADGWSSYKQLIVFQWL